MERLTYRETDGHALLLYGADAKWRKTEQYGILDAAIQKLAAYEDSKLAPEDIPTALEMCKASMALDELKRYQDTGLRPKQVRELQERQDKIVEQLEDAQDEYYQKYHNEHVDIMYNEGKSDGMQVAINIVKGGGLNEENDT